MLLFSHVAFVSMLFLLTVVVVAVAVVSACLGAGVIAVVLTCGVFVVVMLAHDALKF